MEAAPRLYRQRDPKASPLYQLVVDHFDDLKLVYRQRFETTYGPWQGHWDRVIEKFLSCGDLSYGFARVYCDTCRHSYLRAYSCSARGFCPSCEARRRALWAEHVLANVLPPELSYRMAVFTIPRCLRPTFMRERALVGDLSREAYECTRSFLAEHGGAPGVPYFVSVVQWFGDLANAQHRSYYHPLSHLPLQLVFREKPELLSRTPPLKNQFSCFVEPLDDPLNRFRVEI